MSNLRGLGPLALGFTLLMGGVLLCLSFYGLYLAFSASILLGIIVFFAEPSPLVIALVAIFWKVNLPEKILAWLL